MTIGLILFAFVVVFGAFLLWNNWDLTQTGVSGSHPALTRRTLAFVAIPAAVIVALALLQVIF